MARAGDGLAAGETQLAAAACFFGMTVGELVATDRRVFFRTKKNVTDGVTYLELEDVLALKPLGGGSGYQIGVYTATNELLFTGRDGQVAAVEALGRTALTNIDEANAAAGIDARFGGLSLIGKILRTPQGDAPVRGIHLEVEEGGQVRSRPSVAAVVGFGILGLAARKTIDERTLYLSVIGEGVGLAVALPAARGPAARDFAARVNALAGPSRKPASGGGGDDVLDQIRKLGELRDAGVLTEKEFEAKKADLLKRL